MRKLILFLFILSLITSGLYFTQRSQASVSTTIAPAGTPLSSQSTVTNATTNENTLSSSGLVLDHNAADGAEVAYFKIGSIRKGTLYKNEACILHAS